LGNKSSTKLKCAKITHNCINCNEIYLPDRRNIHHQHYCSKAECRKASKAAAQRKWLSSSKGEGYFKGTQNTQRVQLWIDKHPEYSRQKIKKKAKPLQDLLSTQLIENKQVDEISASNTLQDLYLHQVALLIGLISTFTGNTLQDGIAKTARRLIDSGQDILCNAIK
jgi:hypothetical protein